MANDVRSYLHLYTETLKLFQSLKRTEKNFAPQFAHNLNRSDMVLTIKQDHLLEIVSLSEKARKRTLSVLIPYHYESKPHTRVQNRTYRDYFLGIPFEFLPWRSKLGRHRHRLARHHLARHHHRVHPCDSHHLHGLRRPWIHCSVVHAPFKVIACYVVIGM